jgi:hypothetical protein
MATSPNTNYGEIAATTIENRSGVLADSYTTNTALLYRLMERGNKKPIDGGRVILEELFYAENSTYKRYAGYEQLDITPSSVISAAQYNIKQAAIAVSMSGLEELQNSGEEEIINLLESRIENAEGSFINNLSNDVYSAGTADGGLQINGLQALVSDTGTGTVGGIDSGTWTFWQNQTFSFSTNSLVPSASTIQTAMNRAYTLTKRNRDEVDLIVADNIYWRYYLESLQAHQRFTNEGLKNAGFSNLKFFNADVVLDGGYGGDAPASHMYFLQTKYILYRPHRRREMKPLDPKRFSVNQDAFVVLIGWAGNMTARNRQLQCVIVA